MAVYNRQDFKTTLPQLELKIDKLANSLKALINDVKSQIDKKISNIVVPINVSELINDSGYLTLSDLVTEQHVVSKTLNVASGSFVKNTYTVNKSGYYPLGVVGWLVVNGSGTGGTFATAWTMHLDVASDGSAQLRAGIRAVGGAVTNCTLIIDVLWKKL